LRPEVQRLKEHYAEHKNVSKKYERIKQIRFIEILALIFFMISSLPIIGFGFGYSGSPLSYYSGGGAGATQGSSFSLISLLIDWVFWSVVAAVLVILNEFKHKSHSVFVHAIFWIWIAAIVIYLASYLFLGFTLD
jgi:hypothetical protein